MEVVNLLAPAKRRLIEVIPLLGESSHTWSYTQMNQIVLQMAKSFGGRPHFLLVPLMVGSKAMRDDLMNDEVARQVVERWDRLDVACVGIGALPPTEGQVLYMGEENVSCFLEKGAVGDICARYYDIHGKHIESEMYDRLIGITPEQLKKIKVLIAVAAGIDKMRAVVGALHSSLVTDLYLDEELAKAIVSELR